jgi:hypothetical protein
MTSCIGPEEYNIAVTCILRTILDTCRYVVDCVKVIVVPHGGEAEVVGYGRGLHFVFLAGMRERFGVVCKDYRIE